MNKALSSLCLFKCSLSLSRLAPKVPFNLNYVVFLRSHDNTQVAGKWQTAHSNGLGATQAIFCMSHDFPSLLTGLLTGNVHFAYSVITTVAKTEGRKGGKESSLDPLADNEKYRCCITVLWNGLSPPEWCMTVNQAWLRKLLRDTGCLIFLHSLHKCFPNSSLFKHDKAKARKREIFVALG